MSESVTYNEQRLSLIISCLLEKLGTKRITLDLKEDVDLSTPVLLVSDISDNGSVVTLQNLSQEDAEKQVEAFKEAQNSTFQ